MTPRFRYSLVACARWETPYIDEWLRYHRSIGFDHVYLYCNDDDPAELQEAVRPFTSFVTFRHHAEQGAQREMYLDFLRNDRGDSEWIMLLDIDEFLCLRGIDDVHRFVMPRASECDALYFNWVYFGNNNFVQRPGGSVLLQYTRREPAVNPYTKVLIRSSAITRDDFTTAFWHDWIEALGSTLRARNVLGDPMQGYYDNFPDAAWRYLHSDEVTARILRTAHVCHFAFKARDDHAFRIARGTSGDFHRQDTWAELANDGRLDAFLAGANSIEDTYLRDYWQRCVARESQVR